MSHLAKNQAFKLKPGTVILGKWNRNRYKIIKELGSGAIGVVYLVQSNIGLSALKIGFDKMGIVSEVNVLKQLTEVQGQSLGPSFIEMDDWSDGRLTWTFYVMEYLQGESLFSFLKKRGNEWISVFMLQLLAELEKLHEKGWVFGDLKPENLIIVGPTPRIRWLDVGGVTQIGRSIREYTAFFDRGYWGAGSRKAEPSYDLFSLAMIFLNLAFSNRFAKTGEGLSQLEKKVSDSPLLSRYEPVLIRALSGEYSSANRMRIHFLQQLSQQKSQSNRKRNNPRKTKGKHLSFLLKLAMFVSFLLVLNLLYLYFK